MIQKPLAVEIIRDLTGGITVCGHFEHLHNQGRIFIWIEFSVWTFAVSHRSLQLARRIPGVIPPLECHKRVGAGRLALRLGERSIQRHEQFPCLRQGIDILEFKEHPDTKVL